MKKVDDYIKRKIEDGSLDQGEYELIKEKAKVVSKIIEYRNKHNLTQKQLGDKIGVSQQYISKIEEGDFHNLEDVDALLHPIGYTLKLNVEPWSGFKKLLKVHNGFEKYAWATEGSRKKKKR